METQNMYFATGSRAPGRTKLGRAFGRWLFRRYRQHYDFFQVAGPVVNTTVIGTTISATQGTIHPGVVYCSDDPAPIQDIFEAGRARGVWECRPLWRKALDAAVTRWG